MKLRRTFALLSSLLLPALLVLVPATADQSPQPQPQTAAPAQQPADESQASPAAQAKLRRLRAAKPTYRVGYSPAVEVNVQDLADIEIPPDLPKTILSVRARSARWLAQREAAVAQWE